MSSSVDLDQLRADLWGSFLRFTRVFFPYVTGRDFVISSPPGRESHFITIARELTLAARMQNPSLIINVPPGHGKSVMLSMWVSWTMSRYPNSQFLYISYGKTLATKHTEFIKRVISCKHYRDVFGVEIRHDSKAKDFFQTTAGGAVKSFGSSGAITGQDGGLPNCEHFSGAVIMDDMHKPDEVHSDTIRQAVIDNYRETILQRPRAPNVPMVFIGQRLHEDDLPAYMLSGNDERQWKDVVLKSIDEAGNALYPDVNPLAQLREKQEKNPYVFASRLPNRIRFLLEARYSSRKTLYSYHKSQQCYLPLSPRIQLKPAKAIMMQHTKHCWMKFLSAMNWAMPKFEGMS